MPSQFQKKIKWDADILVYAHLHYDGGSVGPESYEFDNVSTLWLRYDDPFLKQLQSDYQTSVELIVQNSTKLIFQDTINFTIHVIEQ